MYTDGITEAPDPDDTEFGLDRLGEVLLKRYSLSPDELGRAVTDEVAAFTKGLPQFDDITYLVLKFT